MISTNWFAYLLALYKDLNFSVVHDCIIDFFTLFSSDICGELRDNFIGVEYIVAKHQRYKGHYKCILGRFFGLDTVFLRFNLFRNAAERLDSVHLVSPNSE